MKRDASLDSSFWITACGVGVTEFLLEYYRLFACQVVADEILYPLRKWKMPTEASERFQTWLEAGHITVQDPTMPLEWFQVGENSAAALARERGYRLLIDDQNPYHFARAHGVMVVGTADFIVGLYLQKRLTYQQALEMLGYLTRFDTAEKLVRTAMAVLGEIARGRGER